MASLSSSTSLLSRAGYAAELGHRGDLESQSFELKNHHVRPMANSWANWGAAGVLASLLLGRLEPGTGAPHRGGVRRRAVTTVVTQGCCHRFRHIPDGHRGDLRARVVCRPPLQTLSSASPLEDETKLVAGDSPACHSIDWLQSACTGTLPDRLWRA